MDSNKLESVEAWQCAGDNFETFEDTICRFFNWNCDRHEGSARFHWQMNLGVLRSQDGRLGPRVLMARLVTSHAFVQTQSTTSHDVVIILPAKGSLRLEGAILPKKTAHPDGQPTTQFVSAGAATIYQPRAGTRIVHACDGEGCEAYIIKLNIDWVRRFLYEILQMPIEQDLHLGPVIDMTAPKARLLARLISTLCSDTFTFQSRELSVSLQERLAETFGHMLLESIPHRYSARMRAPGTGPLPNYLRVARDYMHKEARSNPTVAAVARAANISIRTLETSFRGHLDVTPHTYLRTLRLQLAHRVLKDPADTRSIAAIANDHGFPHAGRFASYYAGLFGEAPSDTRRKGAGN